MVNDMLSLENISANIAGISVLRSITVQLMRGSIVAVLCDGGERYATSYYNPEWLKAKGYELEPLIAQVAACAERGEALPDLLTTGL